MTRAPTVVSLFSGAGGLDIGLERAGFRTVSALDADPDCVSTLRASQARKIPIGTNDNYFLEGTRILDPISVSDVSAKDLTPHEVGSSWVPDLLVGGPPCQPFSSAGKMLGLDDPRGKLFEEFVRLAKELQPKQILFENVRGLVTARGPKGEPGEVIRMVERRFRSAGYATNFAILNAADFGAPQRRVRCFMLAARVGSTPIFPEPTRAESPLALLGLSKWMTLGECLAQLPPPSDEEIVRPTAKLASELERLPNGSGLKSAGARETTRPGGHWGYRQGTFIADPEKPARTVTAASSQDWIRDPHHGLRRLTIRECAALQGFHPEWQFHGGKASQFRQVGNAVPAIFGEVLGKALLDAVKKRGELKSVPLPWSFSAAWDYTKREHARNGESRKSVRDFIARGDDPESVKGIGNHQAGTNGV